LWMSPGAEPLISAGKIKSIHNIKYLIIPVSRQPVCICRAARPSK
jgi:hypothetical protein